MRTLRGGLDPDITIDGVEPFFGGPDGITLCEALAEREPRELCRKNSHTTANLMYTLFFSFKRLAEDLNPPPAECHVPTDPGCMDVFGATQLRLDSFDGGEAFGSCAELLGR